MRVRLKGGPLDGHECNLWGSSGGVALISTVTPEPSMGWQVLPSPWPGWVPAEPGVVFYRVRRMPWRVARYCGSDGGWWERSPNNTSTNEAPSS